MTPEVVARYGAAFGRFLAEGADVPVESAYVLVGRDSRVSGESLASAAATGLRSVGLDVRLAGIAPTPSFLLTVADDEAAIAALVVTASHNPIEWNGLKLASAGGRFISPSAGRRVQEIFEATRALLPDRGHLATASAVEGVLDHHIDRILALPMLAADRIAAARPQVALDCVHGAGGALMPRLLEGLGCRVAGIGLETDGQFPRNPEPSAANLSALGELVRASGSELGLAVDPDGDRLSLVDGRGLPVGEDWTLALAAEYVLSERRGPVVTNLSSSQCIEDVATSAGVAFYRTAVGESHVARTMLDVGAVIGGEGNGGVMLPDLNLTRDAPAAAALILSLLAREGRRLEDILAARRGYCMVKRKASRPMAVLEEVYDALESEAAAGADADRADGLRLAWRAAREWVHVRPSGTEPVVRIIAEAPEENRALALADWAGSLLVARGS
jgi:phosphomannomutase